MATKAIARSPGHRCSECGWSTVKWVGRCGECQAWGTVSEIRAVAAVGSAGSLTARTTAAVAVDQRALRIGEVDARQAESHTTGVGEFDRVLGGGLVRGAVVLVAGEPGIGKSTLLLDVAARAARQGQRVLYISGEESAAQVRMRAERIEAMARNLFLAAETDLATVLGQISQLAPDLVVIDSVQTIASGEVEGAAGNVSQVREVAASLIHVAKTRDISILLVGHVTKDGSIAGPRVLEHLVDVVIQFEGERHSRLRLVRAVKNRYGPTDEVGCFDLCDIGIVGLPDPSGLFLSSRDLTVPGTCVTVALEGRRPLVTEVQALLLATTASSPRRTTSGLDSARVLDKRAKLAIRQADCYVSTVGGVKISEPASDLAIALAMASSVSDRAVPPGTVAMGEVGLAGEIRAVTGIPRRLAEAARLGFRRAVVPKGALANDPAPAGMDVIEVCDIRQAVGGCLGGSPPPGR
jgi:DNA repair protein RadA/Sms